MGQPKGLLPLDGVPVLARHVDRLAEACASVVVVLGAEAATYRALLEGREVTIVVNDDWSHTMPSDSLRLGLGAVSHARDVLVTPVDVLPARRSTLERLLAGSPPCVPVGPRGRRGHPVRLGAAERRRISDGPVSGGLRHLLTGAREVFVDDPFVEGDFDDPDSWVRARDRWRAIQRDTG